MTAWNKIIFFSRAFMFLAAFTGVYLEITKRGGLGMLLYYTVLSNLLVMIFTGYLLWKMRREGDYWQSSSLLRLKGGITMCIMITCVIYHFMLAPLTKDFYRLENFLCHYIVPLWFLVDTIIFDKSRQYKWFDPMLWTSLPLFYMIFAILNGFVIKMDVPNAKDSPFPYFFLNAPKHGWGFVFRWAATIFIAYMVSGYLFYLVKNIKKSKK